MNVFMSHAFFSLFFFQPNILVKHALMTLNHVKKIVNSYLGSSEPKIIT